VSTPSVDAALRDLVAALDEAKLRFALIGGYAVVTWGIPRATYDVDVLVEPAERRMPALFRACEARGFAVDDAYKGGWRDHVRDMLLVKVQVFRGDRAVTCDVFPVATPFQESAFARREEVAIPGLGRSIAVVSAADLILFKLLADRPKDRLDVQNVLVVQGVPDESYLRDWARRLDIEDRLALALADARGTE
jgi:hypothetical protein